MRCRKTCAPPRAESASKLKIAAMRSTATSPAILPCAWRSHAAKSAQGRRRLDSGFAAKRIHCQSNNGRRRIHQFFLERCCLPSGDRQGACRRALPTADRILGWAAVCRWNSSRPIPPDRCTSAMAGMRRSAPSLSNLLEAVGYQCAARVLHQRRRPANGNFGGQRLAALSRALR